jgi:hypothetical protein
MRTTVPKLIAVLALVLAVGLASAPAFGATSGPVADCNANARLTKHYTAAELRSALATMPADVKAYTDCYDVIQRALLAELGQQHGSGSGGSGGSFLPTPVVVLIVVLLLAAAGFGTAALRRRGDTGGAQQDD